MFFACSFDVRKSFAGTVVCCSFVQLDIVQSHCRLQVVSLDRCMRAAFITDKENFQSLWLVFVVLAKLLFMLL